MSINIEEIAALANQLFKGDAAGAVPPVALPSAGGVGSPAPQERLPQNAGQPVDLTNPPTAHPDPHFPSSQGIPASVAGEGVSPSYRSGAAVARKSNTDDSHFLPDFFPPLPAFGSGWPSAVGGDVFSQAGAARIGQPEYYFLPSTGVAAVQHSQPTLDAYLVKQDFPILQERVNGKPLVWLDNAATTQKPFAVIDRIRHFYEHENSNVHRAAHELAARSTDAYEGAREKVRRFLNAASVNEIVFLRGTTEAINLVAKTFGEQHLREGDEVLITHLEHHANIVPWQQLAKKKGVVLKVAPVDDNGQVILEEYARLLTPRTKLVSFTQVSNALGTVTPAKQMIDLAHANGAKVLLDGAQSVSHIRVDLQALNPDFFVFSGHKIFGPTGIGVLYGKEALLNSLDPWQGGGNMIKDVTFEHTEFHPAPYRFEAGTGNIADAVGLGAALDYVTRWNIDAIYQYEHFLLEYATHRLREVPGLKLVGTAPDKTSVLSFVLDGYTNDQVGKILNQEGIAVRTGHHCAQPILRRFGLESTVRPSLAFYNTCADVDLLADTLWRLKK